MTSNNLTYSLHATTTRAATIRHLSSLAPHPSRSVPFGSAWLRARTLPPPLLAMLSFPPTSPSRRVLGALAGQRVSSGPHVVAPPPPLRRRCSCPNCVAGRTLSLAANRTSIGSPGSSAPGDLGLVSTPRLGPRRGRDPRVSGDAQTNKGGPSTNSGTQEIGTQEIDSGTQGFGTQGPASRGPASE